MEDRRAMTKGERDELGKLIRHREKVLKSAASQRSAELLAEFEQQMASIYSYDTDETWKEAAAGAQQAVSEAQKVVAARCAEIGIPAMFAPKLHVEWYGRGENAAKERRAELRAVARSRIAAIEKAAVVKIEMACLDAQTAVTASGLTSEGAQEFFTALPKVEMLMPPLELKGIEDMLRERKANRHADYLARLPDANQLVNFNWSTAQLGNQTFRTNGRTSSTMLTGLNGQFPQGLTVHRQLAACAVWHAFWELTRRLSRVGTRFRYGT